MSKPSTLKSNQKQFKQFKVKSSNTVMTKQRRRSNGLLAAIRRGGRNFKIRCKTTTELWRKWIIGDGESGGDSTTNTNTTSQVTQSDKSQGQTDIVINVQEINVN